MATLAVTHPTLLDFARRMDPDNKIATIVEILNETNAMLEDMVWMEGNLPTGHRTTIRTGLPLPTWRKLYGGVQPTKSTTVQVTDATGMLEAYAEVDKALADLNGNTPEFRLTEDRAHLEGMNQEHQQTLIYGDEATEPEAFTGLSPRYNSLSAENAINIIVDPDSTTPDTSIWLIVWGNNTIHGIFPKGSRAGFQMNNKGQVTIEQIVAGTVGRMEAYRTHYRWDCGLTVRDWRFAVRIQFDISEALANPVLGTNPHLPDLMTQALELPPNLSSGRVAFYMNRATLSLLRRQSINVSSSQTTFDTVGGKHVTMFADTPVRRCDQLTSTEATIV